jgi:hypothetical protein
MGFLVAAVAPPKVMPLPTGADDFEMEMAGEDNGVGPRPVLTDFSGSGAADVDDMKLNDDDGAVISGSVVGGTGVCKNPKPLLDAEDSAAAGAGPGAGPNAPPFPMNENPEAAGPSATGAGASVVMKEKPDAAVDGFSSLPSLDDVPFTSNPPNMILTTYDAFSSAKINTIVYTVL